MPLASTIADTVTPCRSAITDRESPYSTVTTSSGSVVVGGAVVVGVVAPGIVNSCPT